MNSDPHEDDRDDRPDEIPALRELRLLRRDEQPPRDLWPGIQARLKPRRSRRRTLVPMALAASLALALGLRLTAPLETPSPGSAAPPLAAATQPATRPLAAENRALVQAHLKIVDGAEAEVLRALRSDPDSASLQRLLKSTRGQRRELRRILAA